MSDRPALVLRIACKVLALEVLAASGSTLAAAGPAAPVARAFTDCARLCPTMVGLPGGTFVIGSPDDEPGRYRNEGPQRTLALPPFAVGATEVTRDQYAAFVRATGRPTPRDCPQPGDGSTFTEDRRAERGSWREPGFAQAGDHPAVCVSWRDAAAYATWLSRLTGHTYSLPTEAQWEYAARGGSTSAFFWGADAQQACRYANGSDPALVRKLPAWLDTVRRAAREGDGRAGLLPCDDGYAFTNPVRRYRPNPFGLYGMSGNVWEHVADCWVAGGYAALADDGSPGAEAGCSQRRVRGGSWDDYALDLRSARRTGGLSPAQRRNDTGFRVVRVLAPARR